MEETLKNRLILILGILTVICFFSTVSSCVNAQRHRSARDKEMLTRLDLEEKMNKAGQERQVLEKKLTAISQELAQEKSIHDTTKKELLQEKAVAQSLKEELGKVTKLKDKLEDDLKEALVAVKAAQTKK
jgi:predicted Holliday junction resolvase-like endonuclease